MASFNVRVLCVGIYKAEFCQCCIMMAYIKPSYGGVGNCLYIQSNMMAYVKQSFYDIEVWCHI